MRHIFIMSLLFALNSLAMNHNEGPPMRGWYFSVPLGHYLRMDPSLPGTQAAVNAIQDTPLAGENSKIPCCEAEINLSEDSYDEEGPEDDYMQLMMDAFK